MAREPLGRLRCDPSHLREIVENATLRSGDADAHDVVFTRCFDDRLETPASTPHATQVSYCTGRESLFDELTLFADGPIDALFDIDALLSWLSWLERDDEPVTCSFTGDPATGVAERLRYRTERSEVVIPCDTDWTLDDIRLSLPDRFDGAQFLDESGEPMPTRVRTEAAELRRLAAANDLARRDDEYALVIDDGELRIDVNQPGGVRVTGTADATVEGPDVRTTLGSGFQRVVATLRGSVELQTGPRQPVAIVQTHEQFTVRFVLYPT